MLINSEPGFISTIGIPDKMGGTLAIMWMLLLLGGRLQGSGTVPSAVQPYLPLSRFLLKSILHAL